MCNNKRKKSYFWWGVITFLLLLCSIAGALAKYINPIDSVICHYFGLGLPIILILDVVMIIIWIILRKPGAAICPLIAILINFGFIYNMFGFDSVNETPKDLRVATYNVHGFYGASTESAYRVSSLLSEAKVDIVSMQEYEAGNDSIVNSCFNFFTYGIREGEHAIYSKYPIIRHYYSKFEGSGFSYLWADIDCYDTVLRVISAHLQTTGVTSSISDYQKYGSSVLQWINNNFAYNVQVRTLQMQKILSIADTTKIPLLVCMDMNDTPASYIYKSLKKEMNDDFTSCGTGYASTYYGAKNMMRIDYIFFSRDFIGLRRNTSSVRCSDHKAVILDLKMEKQENRESQEQAALLVP